MSRRKPQYPSYWPQREDVEGLWACGYTAREIAEELGWAIKRPEQMIVHLRRDGFDLPYRRSAGFRKGASRRMRKEWA